MIVWSSLSILRLLDILKKLGDIEALLDTYYWETNASETQKLQTKLAHVMNRLDEVELEGDYDKETRKAELVTKVLGLLDAFQGKTRFVCPQIAVALSILPAGQFQAG